MSGGGGRAAEGGGGDRCGRARAASGGAGGWFRGKAARAGGFGRSLFPFFPLFFPILRRFTLRGSPQAPQRDTELELCRTQQPSPASAMAGGCGTPQHPGVPAVVAAGLGFPFPGLLGRWEAAPAPQGTAPVAPEL